MPNRLILYFDGASKGNPGASAGGAYIVSDPPQKSLEFELNKYIGRGTNNEAEYTGVLLGLQKILELLNDGAKVKELIIKGDSQLVIKQLLGKWKVHSFNLMGLYNQCIELLQKITNFGVSYSAVHIRRNLNARADHLANQAIP